MAETTPPISPAVVLVPPSVISEGEKSPTEMPALNDSFRFEAVTNEAAPEGNIPTSSIAASSATLLMTRINDGLFELPGLGRAHGGPVLRLDERLALRRGPLRGLQVGDPLVEVVDRPGELARIPCVARSRQLHVFLDPLAGSIGDDGLVGYLKNLLLVKLFEFLDVLLEVLVRVVLLAELAGGRVPVEGQGIHRRAAFRHVGPALARRQVGPAHEA